MTASLYQRSVTSLACPRSVARKRLQQEDRDGPLGAALVVGVAGKHVDGALPPLFAFVTGQLAGDHVLLVRAVLELHLGVGEKVGVPARVLRRPALRRDGEVA